MKKEEAADAAARAEHARFLAELEEYLQITAVKLKRPVPNRVSTLPPTFVAENLAGRETYPQSWKNAFNAFQALIDDFGATTAIEIFETIVFRAREALVVPKLAGRGPVDNPEDTAAELATLDSLRRQGMSMNEALEAMVPDDPEGNLREALLRKLQRFRPRIRIPKHPDDN